MRILVVISLFLACASAQFIPFPGYGGFPPEDQYAASLSGAPVGLYDKKHVGSGPFGSPYGGSSDVTGASLAGAKVGIYGKEHPAPAPYVPFVQPYPVRKPGYFPKRGGYGKPVYY